MTEALLTMRTFSQKIMAIIFFEKIKVTHIYCEGNRSVDWLANKAVYRNDKMAWKDDLSKGYELRMIINEEVINNKFKDKLNQIFFVKLFN